MLSRAFYSKVTWHASFRRVLASWPAISSFHTGLQLPVRLDDSKFVPDQRLQFDDSYGAILGPGHIVLEVGLVPFRFCFGWFLLRFRLSSILPWSSRCNLHERLAYVSQVPGLVLGSVVCDSVLWVVIRNVGRLVAKLIIALFNAVRCTGIIK